MGMRSNQLQGGLVAGLALAAAAFSLALAAAPAAAQSGQPIGPWDGSNPFRCINQDVGEGTEFPHPDADPFCVEFDKTSQNVTDFGIVDFTLQEPFRVAAAGDKCFYFQRDHWTGSVVQGGDPELWHWDGSYFFDRAKGVGGAHVTNFRIGGEPADATPFVPAPYRPYFSPTGGGGVRVLVESDPDPVCRAKVDTAAERDEVYAGRPQEADCIEPGGRIAGRRVGKAKLRSSPERLREKLGAPRKAGKGVWRWCVVGGSSLRVVFGGKGIERGAVLIRTNARGQHVKGIGPGSKRAKAARRLGLSPLGARVKGRRVWEGEGSNVARLLVGTRGGRVRWIALADPQLLADDERVLRALRKA